MLSSRENDGLGDERQCIHITRRFIMCLYRIQSVYIDMFPTLNVKSISSITKEMVRNQVKREKAAQFMFYVDFL